jgi:hypothetical protein
MTGIHNALAAGFVRQSALPFEIFSGTNGFHNSSFDTALSGSVDVNASSTWQINGTIQATNNLDLIILSGYAPSTSSITITTSGYNVLYNSGGRIIAYKISPGGETSAAISLGTSSRFFSVSYTVKGYVRSTAPEISSVATGTSTAPNPPSISPSWGTASPTIFMWFVSQNDGFTAYPAAPDNQFQAGSELVGGATNGVAFGGTRLPATLSSNDPAAATSASSQAWVAHSVAVRGRT